MGLHLYALEAGDRLIFRGANPAADRILGIDHAPLIGQTIETAFPALAGTELPARYRAVAAHGGLWQTERVEYRDDRIAGALDVYAFQTAPGEMAALFLDVTERRRTEHQLRLSEASYRGLLDSVTETVYIQDADGRFLDVNRAAEVMYGYPREAFIGRTPEFLSAPGRNDLAQVAQAIRRALAGEPQQFEFWGRRQDGHEFPKDVSLTPGQYFGRPVVIAVARDITERKRSEDELLRFRYALEKLTDAVFMTDLQGVIQYANPAFERIYGYRPEAVVGQTPRLLKSGLIPPEQYQRLWQTLLNGQAVTGEVVNKTRDGRLIPIEANHTPILDATGRVIGFMAIHRDITERKRAEEALRMFQFSVDQAADAIFWLNRDAGYVYVNDEACRSLGYTREELMRLHLWDVDPVLPREYWDSNWERYTRTRQGGTEHLESLHRRKDGTLFPVEILAQHIWFGDQALHVAFVCDITERKRSEAQMLHDAFHDALTGLPNRALFVDRLEQAIKHARRREGYAFAVLFLDIDRFKVVNDSLGHPIGDRMLVAIAQRLARGLRAADTFARLGGDEFAILLDDVRSPDEAAQIANRILEQLAQPFDLGGLETVTSASIGIVLSAAGHERTEDLLRDADITMYRAKAQGRARYEVFNVSMRAEALSRLGLEADLRRALERDEFRVYYQPIVALRDGRAMGFEALLRWRHPERGLVPPDRIIPVAEESGLILAIDYWVMSEACRQLSAWHRQFPVEPSLTLNVNLSGKHFTRPDLADRIDAILQTSGVPPRSLRLEITESVIMENVSLAIVTLKQLHALGLQIAIDDFGIGYSSLGYLVQLPVDTLKIDRSFVSRMAQESGKAEIVQTIVTLARNLGMTAIAEGIETAEQRDWLAALGCDHGQGYLIATPMDREAATAWLARRLAEAERAPQGTDV